MLEEAQTDVRFLVVHHSASPNNYQPDESIGYLRSFYRYHTSPEKGWPDIAYNFLVDRYGQIFEGRQGSIASPVRGDATGGSQGFALLTCFIGDHSDVAPTEDAQLAMVALLAWLAGTYKIETRPGATAKFVSRGSDRHPEGKLVDTPTITGHRTMSRTTCPGDRAFDLVESAFPERVTAALAGAYLSPTTTATVPPSSEAPSVSSTQVQSEAVSTTEAASEQIIVVETQTQGVVGTSDGPIATSLPPGPVTNEVADPDGPMTTPTVPDRNAGSPSSASALADQGQEAVASRSNGILNIVGIAICTVGAAVEFWRRRRNFE
ncbi:MAG: N-acetylmuramoyl-L-alanine amidase [bacterium]|nr:N-acetylmuramoyl-L-alanine amidase [bacterium]